MPAELTHEGVRAAILEHGGAAQAAIALGCSRATLYKRFPRAVEDAQEELRRRAEEQPLLVAIRVRVAAPLVAELDRIAADREMDRASLALEALRTLPTPLPAPASAEHGEPIGLRMPADTWQALRRAAGRDADGVVRALLASIPK